jgi:hypothetical protein
MQTSRKLILAIFVCCDRWRVRRTDRGPAGEERQVHGQIHLPRSSCAELRSQKKKATCSLVGSIAGVFLNDVTDGSLDKTEVICPFAVDTVSGVANAAHGYCVFTDKDGDKAFDVWEGKDTAPGSGDGTFKWTVGTGKYSGLQGNNTWHFTGIGKTPAGVVRYAGDWRLA